MLASHRHEQLLGGSKTEAHLSNKAEQRVAAAEGASNSHLTGRKRVVAGSSADHAACVIEMLAVWKSVAVEQMAKTLLELTPRQRSEMRQECARQLRLSAQG